jgi:hypothetical protein
MRAMSASGIRGDIGVIKDIESYTKLEECE